MQQQWNPIFLKIIIIYINKSIDVIKDVTKNDNKVIRYRNVVLGAEMELNLILKYITPLRMCSECFLYRC